MSMFMPLLWLRTSVGPVCRRTNQGTGALGHNHVIEQVVEHSSQQLEEPYTRWATHAASRPPHTYGGFQHAHRSSRHPSWLHWSCWPRAGVGSCPGCSWPRFEGRPPTQRQSITKRLNTGRQDKWSKSADRPRGPLYGQKCGLRQGWYNTTEPRAVTTESLGS